MKKSIKELCYGYGRSSRKKALEYSREYNKTHKGIYLKDGYRKTVKC